MHYKGFLFKNKKPDFTKLESYGFACKNGVYKFKTDILDGLNLSLQSIKTPRLTQKSSKNQQMKNTSWFMSKTQQANSSEK